MKEIRQVYTILLKRYGFQGWWPIIRSADLRNGSLSYHPGDYSLPENRAQKFEISIGAILTQNTSWKNVEKALLNLKKIKALSPESILRIEIKKLAAAIRPAGYFNQKSKKMKIFSKFFINLDGLPSREQLLNLWGVGPETADSILLYAYKLPEFVVDAYTRRIFSRIGIINPDLSYDEIKSLFESDLPKDHAIFNEYHALIVKHAKEHCRSKPECNGCVLRKHCSFSSC